MAGRLLRRDLAHAAQRVDLEPLGRGDEDGARGQVRPQRARRPAGRTPRGRHQRDLGVRDGLPRGRGRGERGQGDAGQVARVLAALARCRGRRSASRTHSRTSCVQRARWSGEARCPRSPPPTTATFTACPRPLRAQPALRPGGNAAEVPAVLPDDQRGGHGGGRGRGRRGAHERGRRWAARSRPRSSRSTRSASGRPRRQR